MLPEPETAGHTTKLVGYLQDHAAGRPEALNELLRHAQDRLRRVAAAMMRSSQVARNLHDTDDLLQNAMIGLERAIRAEKPTTADSFGKLMTTKLVQAIRDLSKALHAKKRDVSRVTSLDQTIDDGGTSPLAMDPVDPATHHELLIDWSELHDAIANLPEEQRVVMEHIFYSNYTHDEVSTLLGVCTKTVQRRFSDAKKSLVTKLKHMPGSVG